MRNPYTIRLFIPNGDPNNFKIISKMNWTGVGLEVSRNSWGTYKERPEINSAGVYILVGYDEDQDLPKIYIGQGDGVRPRIDSHEKSKSFWDRAIIFVSSNVGLNRAHITWLEWALITQAQRANRCILDNAATPNEPVLTESEKADTNEFFSEILSVLPLLELKVFEEAKKIESSHDNSAINKKSSIQDVIVVPAQEEGFRDVFLGENCWYAVRIGGGKLKEIKYIAAYQSNPISAVTHLAEVESIEPYGDGRKYKINFKGSAKKISEIPFANAPKGTMQGPTYTTLEKIKSATTLIELFNKP
jgi:hypothetical protein